VRTAACADKLYKLYKLCLANARSV